jgi:hypothetical protein
VPPVKLNQFGGMLPAWDDTLLPEDQAAYAKNTYLYSGALAGWRRPKPLYRMLKDTTSFVYRIPTQTQGTAQAYLVFQDNPVAGDTVTVGEETYTFTATVSKAYDVALGPDATTSAQNLMAALTLNGVFSQHFGQGTCVNPAITGNSPWVGLPFAITNGIDTPGADTLVLIPVEPSGTTKALNIAIMPVVTNPFAKFRGVIYANSLGIPGSLIAVGSEVVGCTAFQALKSTFATQPYLQTAETYWIGFIMDSAVAVALADNGTNGSKAASTYSDGAPPVAPTMSPLVVDWQIWCDMAVISSGDPIDTLGTVTIGASTFPEIIVQAPDFGAAYNLTTVGSSTSAMVWLYADTSLSHTTTTLQGGVNQTQDDSITGPSVWMEFDDPDTDVVRSPVVDDSFQRYYIASPSAPPMYNTYDRIQQGLPPWLLGVPAPGCAPNLSVTGGGNASTVGLAATNSDNSGGISGDYLVLVPVLPTGAMQLNDVSCLPSQVLPSARYTAVVYSDDLGTPATFLAQGTEVQGADGTNIVSSVFAIPFALSSGIQYWIGFQVDTSQLIALADDLNNGNVLTGAATYNDGPPVHAPTMAPLGFDARIWGDVTTQAVLESRVYVYTWVTAYGEEGPPSPPVTETGWSNSTWTIGLFTPVPDEMGVTRNITRTRIYRTISGSSGQTTFFFVAEVDVNTAQYIDVSDDATISNNRQIASTNWFEPPAGLLGIARMPNGMMVGFKANELWFSDSYAPHAWPPNFVITCDFPIVGIGVVGQAVVACTTSQPTVAYGPTPGSITQVKVPITEPCISRGSIVSTAQGVYYASPNGFVALGPDGSGGNVSDTWIRRDKWQSLTPQKFVRAVQHLSAYFAFGSIAGTDHSVAQQGYTIELSQDSQSFTIWPQAGGHRIGFQEMSAPNALDLRNVETDPWSGVCMLVEDDGNVYYYDFTDQAPVAVPYRWRSKVFQQQAKKNMGAFRVFFQVPPGTPPQNPTRTTVEDLGDDIPFAVGMYGVVRVLADSDNDGVLNLVTARELRTSGELMRINSGFKNEFWQFEIEGVIDVQNIQAAPTVKELAQV